MADELTPVARAIEKLGGVHEASMRTGIPAGTLRSARRRGRLGNYHWLRVLAEASGEAIDDLAEFRPPSLSRKTA